MKLPARIRIDAPVSDDRRDAIEHAVLERVAALRAATEAPSSDARRNQIEHQVFAQLDGIRSAERSNFIVPLRDRPRWVPWLASACAMAAAAVVIVLAVGRDAAPGPTTFAKPTRMVTPEGGSSRFVTGDAVIDAGSDTSVEVVPGDNGAITLLLARGTIDCDVTPRAGRPPFIVIAGDVRVEVVGTRFAVARTPAVRVDVTRGKVRVVSPTETRVVIVGESWSQTAVTAVAPTEPDEPEEADEPEEIELAPENARAPRSVPELASEAAFKAAERLEATDKRAAIEAYRKVADGRGTYAATALHALVELEAGRGNVDQVLVTAREFLRRFPRENLAQDVRWLRAQSLAAANRYDEARSMAADYLRRFPDGTYAEKARKLVAAP